MPPSTFPLARLGVFRAELRACLTRLFGVFEDADEWWVERRCGC